MKIQSLRGYSKKFLKSAQTLLITRGNRTEQLFFGSFFPPAYTHKKTTVGLRFKPSNPQLRSVLNSLRIDR